ncbi:hypothetical protein FQA39_LY15883 [Lamprigera yunnana]|nr:hypothetical protein FQA39_LY15883 [Lamprigera yunnana]
MDMQLSQNSLIKLLSNNQTRTVTENSSSIDTHVNSQNPSALYPFHVEQMPDSLSHIVQLNEHVHGLSMFSSVENNIKMKISPKNEEIILLKPLGSSENPIEVIKDGEMLHSTQNLSPEYLQQIAQMLQLNVKREEPKEMENAPPNFFYRVVYPDELNLKPVPTKPVKRGRKKKQTPSDDDTTEVIDMPKVMKGFRTRSGRVTRPPQYIQNDFRKIATSESDPLDAGGNLRNSNLELASARNDTDRSNFFSSEETQKRKRSISSQFRCPECKKAYLGNNKMLRHFEKHPDHRPSSDYYKARYDDTWNYLIDISNKNPVGQRGLKFCREFVNLLNNIRIVAKSLFKNPTDFDKNLFFVDSTLSSVLGIDSGNYVLNESKLHKEVQVLLPCSTNMRDNNNDKLVASANFEVNESTKSYYGENENSYNVSNIDIVSDPSSTLNVLNFNNLNSNSFNLNCDMAPKSFQSDLSFSQPYQEIKSKNIKTMEANKSELSLHNDLLSDNSLLNSLPNLRTSVDELINTQDTIMLDNSASSDEIMNVDQFVNERLKNLTQSDLELPNNLNLDLPSLDLFQFHTS